MNEELRKLRRRIKNFAEADYPRVGKHISLIECLKTITKDPSFNLEGESISVLINNRKFELIDVYCPDLKEPNSFLWDESAKIYLKNGKYVIEYIFDDTSDEISSAIIYEENENGYSEIKGKNYRMISILDKEKARDIDEVSPDDYHNLTTFWPQPKRKTMEIKRNNKKSVVLKPYRIALFNILWK